MTALLPHCPSSILIYPEVKTHLLLFTASPWRCCCSTSHRPKPDIISGILSLSWQYRDSAVGSSLKRIQGPGIMTWMAGLKYLVLIMGLFIGEAWWGSVACSRGVEIWLVISTCAFSCGCLWQCLPSLSTITQPEGLHMSTCLREIIFIVESRSGWGLWGSVLTHPHAQGRVTWKSKLKVGTIVAGQPQHHCGWKEDVCYVSLNKAPGSIFHWLLAITVLHFL